MSAPVFLCPFAHNHETKGGDHDMENLNWKRIAGAYLLSFAVSLGSMAALAMGFAALIAGGKLPDGTIQYGAMTAVLSGSLLGVVIGKAKLGQGSLPVCIGVSVTNFLGLILLGWLLFGKVTDGILPTALLSLCGGMIVGLLGKNGSSRPKYKVSKIRL